MKTTLPARGRSVRIALLYSMLLFAAAWCVWALCTPLLGDDLMTTVRLREQHGGGLLGVLRYARSSWLGNNARMGDLLSPALLGIIPRPLVAVAIGAACMLTMWGVLRLSSATQNKPLISAAAIAVSFVAMPWWNMDYYVCHFNYVWGTALISLILAALFHSDMSSRRWLWGVPIAFVATATHEALGIPLAAGLLMYWYLNRQQLRLSGNKKWWVIAIMAGALMSISSPASYTRALSDKPADLPLAILLVKTLPMLCLLLIRVIYLWIRHKLKRLLRTRWVIFAATAVASSCLTMIGGVEGRGGWYAEFFAIIALTFDFAHSRTLHAIPWKWRKISGMVIALGCNAFAIWFGLCRVEQSGNRQQMVAYYKQIPDIYTTAKLFGKDEEQWSLNTLPLLYGFPIYTEDGSLYYTPTTPLLLLEDNPIDPVIKVN